MDNKEFKKRVFLELLRDYHNKSQTTDTFKQSYEDITTELSRKAGRIVRQYEDSEGVRK